jgi:ABC-type Mn2+/Zn2+ transport system permease subunit
MSDGWKTCFGFGFLILGLALAVISLLAGGIGEIVTYLGGNAFGVDLQVGLYLAIGMFVVLFVAAIAFFTSIRDWSWLPAIAGGIYTVMPDLILGPEDDAVAMIAGVLASGLLAYLKNRREQKQGHARPELPPKSPELNG